MMQLLMLLGLRCGKFWKSTRGQGLIEYALIAGFMALTAGAVMPGVASRITTLFNEWHLPQRVHGLRKHTSPG
jgi:Flp pilus assembly pilin Flp